MLSLRARWPERRITFTWRPERAAADSTAQACLAVSQARPEVSIMNNPPGREETLSRLGSSRGVEQSDVSEGAFGLLFKDRRLERMK